MAIIIEEEKNNGSSLVSWLGPLLIVGIIAAAAYYLFIASPAPAVITPPAGFTDITSISQINFDPTKVVNNPTFQALKQSVAEPTSTGPIPFGRTDPFLQ